MVLGFLIGKVFIGIVLSFVFYMFLYCFLLKVEKWSRKLIKIIIMLRLKKMNLVKFVDYSVYIWIYLFGFFYILLKNIL